MFVVTGAFTSLYLSSTRFAGVYMVKRAVVAVLLSTFLVITLLLVGKWDVEVATAPQIIALSFFAPMTMLASTVGLRIFARELFFNFRQHRAKRAVIFGAGASGVQFLSSTLQGGVFDVVALVDDDYAKVRRNVHGRNVLHSSELERLIKNFQVEVIVLAVPSCSPKLRRVLLQRLSAFSARVMTVPSMEELLEGRVSFGHAREVAIEDLLGREPVPPDFELIGAGISGKTVLITGAGGSIGSELCRQIAKFSPKTLVLLDINEPALFSIEREMSVVLSEAIVPLLGSTNDSKLVTDAVSKFGIQVVFHAAAYKHVPLVERNPFAAIENNVFGTIRLVDALMAAPQVERFTLISTDKAVRPTNVMGASKRIAECVCQARGAKSKDGCGPIVSMVRFGNVLNSSGSVIPTFKAQIANGGPVTVTDPEVTRFFMTIPEAAQLVLQASAMAEGGEVFLLDMGRPIKILDLARQLIQLSGFNAVEVDQEMGPNDIPIVFTGLRPGEKLYEELLVDAEALPTKHPRVRSAAEIRLPDEALCVLLHQLRMAQEVGDESQLRRILAASDLGYRPENLCS